jgi:CubicO group peptidase (beta-lactamase class C family)
MTQPYAAGGLASTIDDLALWDAALYTRVLLQPETLQRAWTPYQLVDGSRTGYGYGWGIGEWQGCKTVEHGGGIHGFVTYALRMPQERVFVAVLSNNTGGPSPELIALKVAGIVIGQPYLPPTPIKMDAEEFAPYIGIYHVAAEVEWVITCEGNYLFARRTGGPNVAFLPLSSTEFYSQDMPFYRLVFTRDAANAVTAAEIHGRSSPPEVARRTDKPLPTTD